MDTFSGLVYVPSTLHKYLYVSARPTDWTDPTGLTPLTELSLGQTIQASLQRTTSTQTVRVAFKKSRCILVQAVVDQAVERGVYIFIEAAAGQPYIGRSIDVGRRLNEHLGPKLEQLEDVLLKFKLVDVTGDAAGDLRVLDQFMIDQVRAESEITNRRNEIAENPRKDRNRKLRDRVNTLKLCKN